MWNRFEKRLDAEMRLHLEQLTQDYIAQGLTPGEARQRALLEFDALDLAKDEVRELRPLEWLRQIGRDVRYAVRGALRTPGFSLAAVTTLALAIGSAVAVFAVVGRSDRSLLVFPFCFWLSRIILGSPPWESAGAR